MAYRSTHYPLGKLLLDCLHKAQLSIQPFVLAIGYRNPRKGIRAFDEMLVSGYPNQVFLERLNSSSLAPNALVLKKAVDQTLEILEEEELKAKEDRVAAERLAFRPFFQAVPEQKTPSQISLFAFTGGHSRYTHFLPQDFSKLALVDQLSYLKIKVSEAFTASKGRTLFMGNIIGYRLFLYYGEPALLLSVNVEPIREEKAAPIPDATLQIGGKSLSSTQAARLLQTISSND